MFLLLYMLISTSESRQMLDNVESFAEIPVDDIYWLPLLNEAGKLVINGPEVK